jgi:hypothetical protein
LSNRYGRGAAFISTPAAAVIALKLCRTGHMRRFGQGRAPAVAASLAAHAAVIAAILWRLGATPPHAQPPIVDVQLVPPWTADYRPPPAASAPTTAASRAPRPILHRPAEAARPAAPAPAPWPVPAPGDDLRPALRALVGCDRAALFGLTAEEREGCRQRLAAARTTDLKPSRLNLDPNGRYAEEAVPYLARKPHNECKPMMGGSAAPSGEQGVAFGIGCEWDF